MRLFLEKLDAAVRKEEQIVYERHAKKWNDLTGLIYPCDSYVWNYEFGFSFEFVDGFWCGTERRLTDHAVLADDFTNETEINLPGKVSALLAKGPKYRLPPILHSFLDGVTCNLDLLTYRLRWREVQSVQCGNRLQIAFHKNTVNLPSFFGSG